MSDKKMYALKNDEGKYWDFYYARFWRRAIPGFYATAIKEQVEIVADEEGGHVVTLIEEPEKVVLTKEQAEIVEEAYDSNYPASYIAGSSDDEKLLMSAYVNGYTLAKEKKYNLILGTDTDDSTNALFKLNYNPCTDNALGLDADTYADDLKLDKLYQFTQSEIDKYNKDFWIKGIDLNDYKVEVEE